MIDLSFDSIYYQPRIKGKGFNPKPVAGNIPFYADSHSNPKCVMTQAYHDFWEEQTYYCTHGYETGGIFIPPRYYDYLNFNILDGVDGTITPYYSDLHHEIYEIDYEARKDDTVLGAIFPKARRKGLTFYGKHMVNYGARFTDSYRAGVAGGLDNFVSQFRSKYYRTYNNTVPEYRLNALVKNDKRITHGYQIRTEQGFQSIEYATILFETMHDDPKKFEGEYFNDVILEEIGEFEKAEETLQSIIPNLRSGDRIIGKVWGLGTGGNMRKGGLTFQTLVSNSKNYQLFVYFIPGRRFYLPYLRTPEDTSYKTPNLDIKYPDLEPEQLLGCEDIKAAQDSLDKEAERMSKMPDKKEYIQHKQNYPDKLEDVFISTGSNNFNNEVLYNQLFVIESNPRKYKEYVLDFIRDANKNLVQPLQVKARPATAKDHDYEVLKIFKHPTNFRNLDVVGIDGYNQDKTNTSKSIGGICVVRRADKLVQGNIGDEYSGIYPVLVYYQRPPRKEIFWELGLKVGVYYQAFKNVMIGADADSMIGYFKNNGGRALLSPRPRSFESKDSGQSHEYGFKATNSPASKGRMISVMQSVIEDYTHLNFFKELIIDTLSYDEENIGTDWDLADAFGHALVRIFDMNITPTNKEDELANDIDEIEWKYDNESGLVIPIEKEKKIIKKNNQESIISSYNDNSNNWISTSPTIKEEDDYFPI